MPAGPRTTRGWAQQLVDRLSPTVRAALAADPAGAIVEHLGLRVQPGDPGLGRGFGGWCDGLSIIDDDRIIYQPTPYSRRENFTLLHEAGHHHSERDEALLNWAHQRPDPEQELERISDYFAATLLLPQELVRGVLAGDPVAARHLPLLYQQSSASREVCAIALAGQLGCEGFVALVDLASQTISFAARAGETRPAPWRDEPLPVGHPLQRLQPGQDRRGGAWWPYPAVGGARSTSTPSLTAGACTRCSPSTICGESPGCTSPIRSRTMPAAATRPPSTARPAKPPGPPAASRAQCVASLSVPSATSATATAEREPSGPQPVVSAD